MNASHCELYPELEALLSRLRPSLAREDQHVVQEVPAGREWWAADPPGALRPWAPGAYLHLGVHDI
ncbi:hypothetical protein [Streptomyces sp. NPDC059874]|uniref:hypothetical protein n=1 Tax=Streptomyces sp. NPDC059874 TaxID=3346983 RepID=UPI003655A1A4